MRSIVFATLLLAAVPFSAAAQESRGSVSAVAGYGSTWDDEGSLGSGWAIGGAIDRVVFGKTRAEVSLEVLTHDRNSGYFLSDGRTVVGGLSLVRRFGSRTQPYVFAGLTVGHHSGTNTFSGVSAPLKATNAGYRGGAGVLFRAGERLEVGPEIRWNGFFVDNDADPVWAPSLGLRFGFRM